MEADLEAVGIAEVEYLLVSHVEADLEAVGMAEVQYLLVSHVELTWRLEASQRLSIFL